jgi:hypothetical protein
MGSSNSEVLKGQDPGAFDDETFVEALLCARHLHELKIETLRLF